VTAQKRLQHKAIVERAGPGRCEIDDLQPGFALHLAVKISEIERHGVRGAEDHPIVVARIGGRDLEERVAMPIAEKELFGRGSQPRINQKTDRDKQER